MNYELLSKLAMEEAEKSKSETLLLKKRNEILNKEVERLESLVKKIEEEKISLKNETTELEKELDALKIVLEFREDEKQHFSHYS